jgi:hypothetical protein
MVSPIWVVRKLTGEIIKVVGGQVFNFKLDHFASKQHKCISHMQPLLELKTWLRFHAVN